MDLTFIPLLQVPSKRIAAVFSSNGVHSICIPTRTRD
jgi:hypothetical protein